jgi:hypothetical protein
MIDSLLAGTRRIRPVHPVARVQNGHLSPQEQVVFLRLVDFLIHVQVPVRSHGLITVRLSTFPSRVI